MKLAAAARIRALAIAGRAPEEIARETGRQLRTVRSVLARPASPWEVAEVDRLTGWAPLCMPPGDWADWQRMNPRIAEAGGFAPRPCTDCPQAFADEMRAVGKCNGTPAGRGDLAAPRTQALASPSPLRVIERPTAWLVSPPGRPGWEATEPVTPSPAPQEETAVSEERPDIPETIPVADPVEILGSPFEGPLGDLESRIQDARRAWGDFADASARAGLAGQAWRTAQRALVDAWRSLPPLDLEDDVRAVPPEATEPDAPAQPAADPTPAAAEPTPRAVTVSARSKGADGLTSQQRRVLDLMAKYKGRRADVARELGVVYQSVDGLLEAMGKKGLLPIELIPLLPARFAKYTGV